MHHLFFLFFILDIVQIRFVRQGRLNELMSQIRMQNHFGAVRSEERYNVDADLLREIRQVSALKKTVPFSNCLRERCSRFVLGFFLSQITFSI